MGRKPMSPELKEARGNPGKRPVKKRETVKTVVTRIVLARPTWLTDKLARQVWDKLQASLHFLRQSDVQVFGRYCVYVADWVTANKEIEAAGMVYETSSAHVEGMLRINPWFTVRSRLEDDLVKLEEKIGLTPLDRQRIMVGMANAAGGRSIGDLFGGGTGDEAAQDAKGDTAPAAEPPLPGEMATVGGLRQLN